MTDKQYAARAFREASQAWRDMGFPKFPVEGHLDGRIKTWDCLTEVLDLAAARLEEAGEKEKTNGNNE